MDELLEGASVLRANGKHIIHAPNSSHKITLNWSCPSSEGYWQSVVDNHCGKAHPELSLHTACPSPPEALGSPCIHIA